MKKATDKPCDITINGSNNKVIYVEGKHSLQLAIVILIAVVILTISHSCPELLADLVRWLISTAIDG